MAEDKKIEAYETLTTEQKIIIDYYEAGWNAAIEAAALIVQPNPHVDEERECGHIAEQIRKLKK